MGGIYPPPCRQTWGEGLGRPPWMQTPRGCRPSRDMSTSGQYASYWNAYLFWFYTISTFYRPQRSCGQGNVFTGVCLSTGGESVCLSACWDARPPPDQAGRTPPAPPPRPGGPPPDQADTPLDQGEPPRPGRPPRTRENPPGKQTSIRSTSSWYASYWNAFFF